MSLRDEAIQAMSYAMMAGCPSYESDQECSGHHAEEALRGLLQWLRDNERKVLLAGFLHRRKDAPEGARNKEAEFYKKKQI